LGLVDEVRGQRICIDTAPLIYFIEGHTRYHDIIRPLFVEIDSGNIEAITSTITLLEVLVLPLRPETKPWQKNTVKSCYPLRV
jgi:predicted nucleic acid-binding protein